MLSVGRVLGVLLALLLLAALSRGALAEMPYGGGRAHADAYDYPSYLFIDGEAELPATFNIVTSWWLTDFRGTDLQVVYNPQEFYGVRGMGANRAWEISTGRPDVIIAIIDSGVRWGRATDCNLLRKYYINRGELPLPAGGPNQLDRRFGGYDVNGDGAFNIEDFWGDPKVTDANGNGWIDPEDLILLFSDGVDGDGNGYVDDISGWDFFEGDNDPNDDVDSGHGANQALHAGSEAAVQGEKCPAGDLYSFGKSPGTCPNCMIMALRFGDSFIGDVNHYAEAAVYAVDNGARVIEVAAGTFNATSFGQAATDYAYRNGVVVNASEADEAGPHHNWPAAYEHALVHNSIRPAEGLLQPESYLYLNGCTNFGSYSHVAIPSASCSSQATGLASGLSGLLVSAAMNSAELGKMTNYIKDDRAIANYPLSAGEIEQLWRLAADDIDFSTFYPEHAFSDLWPQYKPVWWLGDKPSGSENNFGLRASILPTRRYQTVRGWDYFTGYGRINAARLLRYIGIEEVGGTSREFLPGQGPYAVGADGALSAQDRIPPEADITGPRRWRQYGHDEQYRLLLPDDQPDPSHIVVTGRVAANRVTTAGGSFDYIVEWAPGAQGAPAPEGLALAAPGSGEKSAGPWTRAAIVTGLTSACEGELARIPVAEVAAAVLANPYPFELEGDPTGPGKTEKWAVRIRLRVIAHPANPADTVNNEAVQQKQVDVYPAQEVVIADGLGAGGNNSGGGGAPSFRDINGDGRDEMLVPTDDGLIHAFVDLAAGSELPGWPVHTDPMPNIPIGGENAYTSGEFQLPVYGSVQFGKVTAADLEDDGIMEVLAADMEGKLYAWEPDGTPRAGFPATVDYSLSKEPACGPLTIPHCDDYAARKLRDPMNQRDWAIMSPPSVGELDPNYPGLEIAASCSDGHIYIWHSDGTPMPGWPVILRDPQKISSMDPGTRCFDYADANGWAPGSKAIATPSLGDLDGDGDLEVVSTVNEGYVETPNAKFDPELQQLLSMAGAGGNGRVYALKRKGDRAAGTPATEQSAHTQDQAYMPGWPVPVAAAVMDLLPVAGQGGLTQPPLLDPDRDGRLEVATATHYGPCYMLDWDGGSHLGMDGTVYKTFDSGEASFGGGSGATDSPSMPTFAGLAAGSMGGGPPSIAAPSSGLTRLIDIALPGRQTGAEDHIGIWNAEDGTYRSGGPAVVNDLQFLTAPVIADITGDGRGDVIQGTSFGDLNAIGSATSSRFHTGGWQMGSPAVGAAPSPEDGPAFLSIASYTREGFLRLFLTGVAASGEPARIALSQWPESGHDAMNTGNLSSDAERPYPVKGLAGAPLASGILLSFAATGDDRGYGVADHYEIRFIEGNQASPRWLDGTAVSIDPIQPKPAGEAESISLMGFEPGTYTVMLRAYDEVGNGSATASCAASVTSKGLPGDCDGDGSVSIGEVQGAINMFLGMAPASCGADCAGDGSLSIGDLQKVINAFLGDQSGCGE